MTVPSFDGVKISTQEDVMRICDKSLTKMHGNDAGAFYRRIAKC
jgi:hypothetical protein